MLLDEKGKYVSIISNVALSNLQELEDLYSENILSWLADKPEFKILILNSTLEYLLSMYRDYANTVNLHILKQRVLRETNFDFSPYKHQPGISGDTITDCQFGYILWTVKSKLEKEIIYC